MGAWRWLEGIHYSSERISTNLSYIHVGEDWLDGPRVERRTEQYLDMTYHAWICYKSLGVTVILRFPCSARLGSAPFRSFPRPSKFSNCYIQLLQE